MAEEIILPVTPDGNDFADFDDATMAKVNAQIDAKCAGLTVGEAQAYVELYDRLKVICVTRGQDEIRCNKTNRKYADCLAVLKVAGLL